MKTAKLIFPHQLFQFSQLFNCEGEYYLVEEHLYFTQYAFHQQKIAYHRATMKYYEGFLKQRGDTVIYIESNDSKSDVRVLIAGLYHLGITHLILVDPVDDWLLKRIQLVSQQMNMELTILDSPMFLNTSKELSTFFYSGKKKFFQTEFYKQQRVSRDILIDKTGEPLGGKWTFDTENRKRYPKGKQVPVVLFPPTTDIMQEARTYTQQFFSHHLGNLDGKLNYPVNHTESEKWLNHFLEQRLADFGDYEDAIVHRELVLHHSMLTPMLNVGLLTPQQVINQTLLFAEKHQVPLNSLEGFIRQIIGWREFIRGVYMAKGREERTTNYWGFTRKIPPSFYDGTTGILPIDETIKKVLKTGYCHHIERLMVLGNFMLLCEFDPDEVYRWFMEMFIDAYDWVMVPNVYGMSQFADGGLMSTKPYISGSNYLMKMSDYPKGEWQQIWDALFWRFMDKQRHFFLKNPRLGMLVKTYDQWDEAKRQAVYQIANIYLAGLG